MCSSSDLRHETLDYTDAKLFFFILGSNYPTRETLIWCFMAVWSLLPSPGLLSLYSIQVIRRYYQPNNKPLMGAT